MRPQPDAAVVAETWGRLAGAAARAGRTLSVIDGLLAATALHYDLLVATRNERDFPVDGLRVVNPWQAGGAPP